MSKCLHTFSGQFGLYCFLTGKECASKDCPKEVKNGSK